MVKKLQKIVIGLTVCALFTSTVAFAEAADTVSIQNNNTTVQNSLPQVRIYCETTESYNTDNISVELDGYPAEVINKDAFINYGEGANYYMLLDCSSSLSEEDFAKFKKAIVNFGKNNLTEKDSAYLIPFGEKVYLDYSQEGLDPTSTSFSKKVNALKAEDEYTNLYDAIDKVAESIDAKFDGELKRNIVLVFTDGIDDTTGGYKNADEAINGLKVQGTPLYSFVIDGTKKSKDAIGELSRELNGRLYTGNVASNLKALDNSIDNTLTIHVKANNAADIGTKFTVTVNIEGVNKAVEKRVVANKGLEEEQIKNSFKYTAIKLVSEYWWIIALLGVAIIALVVILVLRRHKEVVVVDGKTVYSNNITKRQHIKFNSSEKLVIEMKISIDGSDAVTKNIEMTSSLIVGRASTCDLYFDDPTMARQNFSIECIEGRLYIKDLDSTNGTVLNGIKISSIHELHRGDTIVAGKSKIIVNW